MSKAYRDIVELSILFKSFSGESSPALDGITAVCPAGQIIGLVGPDGAGKTTLIRLIAGLLLPTSGSIRVAGYDTVTEAAEIHKIIGYMPQKFGLYEDLTVMQNLSLYADLKGLLPQEREPVFKQLLHFTGLGAFTHRLASALSGGMKQKLGLACALLKKPQLLLLDEPSVGVDPLSRRDLWKIVHNLIDEGISVIWSTAYLDEAERCHSVLLLNEGKLLYYGVPDQLTRSVTGRTFKLTAIQGSHRQLLEDVLLEESVIDGIIQGQNIHIVTREKTVALDSLNKGEHSFEVVPEEPRFEDAFIDILGGAPKGGSQLAKNIPKKECSHDIVIEAQQLTRYFGDFRAVDHVNFSVKQGEIFGLLGPNGAGKTTTFRMMCGLLKPSSGRAFVNGLDLQVASGFARAHIGYMAQKFSLYDNLSVRQNLNFFSGAYNLVGSARARSIDMMIDVFSLQPYLNNSAGELPLGFKQRLALACAVMHNPEVLFLDEPTSGVDPITRREFWTHINGLVDKGVTIIVTTHFMEEAEYCDRIGLIYRSKLISLGTPEELKAAAVTKDEPNPSLESTFIHLITSYDANNTV
jgi:ABC-2 type transport system ATP-binding protein